MAKPLHTVAGQGRLFYGWVVVAAAALTYFFSGPGQTFAISMFVDPMLREFGWSRSLFSGAYSAATLAAGALMPLMGRLIDRYGHRRMLTVIVIAFGAACLWFSFVTNPLMLGAGFLLARLLGQGSMTLIPSTLVAQWFDRQRGRALALAALGMSASSALLPSLNSWFIDHWGWRATWQFWALLLWAVMIPVALLLVRDRPEDMDPEPGHRHPGGAAGNEAPGAESFTLREAAQTRAFWLLLLVTMMPGLVATGLTFHLVSVLGLQGHTPTQAAAIFPIAALAYLPCMLAAGVLAERVPTRLLVAGWLGFQAVSLVWVLLAPPVLYLPILGVLYGVALGLGPIVGGILWVTYFGRRHLGSIQGVAVAAMVVGTSLGPLPFGLSYDLTGSYQPILWTLVVIETGLAALAVTIGPPAHPISSP